MLEKVIKTKLYDFLENNNILPAEQFGFRKHHSTVHQVKRITEHIKQNFNQQKSTGLIALDVEKAFDSVWHKGILYKLLNFGLPNYLIKIIKSFLFNRYYVVVLNNEFSDLIEIPAGVPQGSVLGPILYIIFCADIPKRPNNNYAIHADNLCIYCSDEFGNNITTELQCALAETNNFFNKWKIKLNTSKTQAIFFSRKRNPRFLPSSNISHNGSVGEFCKSFFRSIFGVEKFVGFQNIFRMCLFHNFRNFRFPTIAVKTFFQFIKYIKYSFNFQWKEGKLGF